MRGAKANNLQKQISLYLQLMENISQYEKRMSPAVKILQFF